MTNYTLEADFQRDCNKYLDYLIKQGFPIDYIHLPKTVNYRGKGVWGRSNSKDKLDTYIMLPKGKLIIVELKIEGRSLEPGQAKLIHKYDKMGYDTYVINDDIVEFKAIILREIGI
ncbi:hypothetical protein KAR91_71640 [Candidatus Pacearchaeota archaeon]|nr:hypothetical protein [Candidatus Pacearchaeota archaeon]